MKRLLLTLLLCLSFTGCAHLDAAGPDTTESVSNPAPPHVVRRPEAPVMATYAGPDEAQGAGDTRPDDGVPRRWPVAHDERTVISPYGSRSSGFHKGIDIKAPQGAPVIAAAGGVVQKSGTQRGYGQYVVIEHSAEFSTVYGHLKERLVEVGEEVRAGETIGLLGATGNATTHHVHFEVVWKGDCADPAIFLPAWEYLPGFEPDESSEDQ